MFGVVVIHLFQFLRGEGVALLQVVGQVLVGILGGRKGGVGAPQQPVGAQDGLGQFQGVVHGGVGVGAGGHDLGQRRNVEPDVGLFQQLQAQFQLLFPAGDGSQQAVPTKCSRVIGVLVPDLHDPTYMEGAYALTCFLDKAGFSVIVMNGGDSDRQRADTVACLAKRHVEGAVLVGSKFGSPEVSESLRDHLGEVPVLTVNSSFTLPNVYSVVADEANGVRQCVGYLYRRGRRKLLLLLDKDCPSSDKKESGFQAGCAEYPDISGHICRNVIATTENAAQAIRLAIAEAPDCDAILCSGDMLAAYVERHMQNLGYQIPGQISLIGMGNTCFSEVSNPRISSLNTRMVDGCLQAGQLLVRLLEGEQVERSTTLTCDLIIREST